MDLLQSLLQGAGPGVVREISARFGIDENQAASAISALLPALQNTSGNPAQAAAASGLDAGLLNQLAPLLSGLLTQGGAQGGLLGAVTSMLDANKNGSAADDILGMAQSFFNKK